MDIWSKQKRSEVMSKIKGKNTKPEMILRSELFKLGFRYRVHKKDLPGKPDIVFPKFRIVIFVHGCFWHHHKDCREGRIPDSNFDFWQKKMIKNVERDESNIKFLEENNWKVFIVWECEIEKNLNSILKKIINEIYRCSLLNKQLSKV